MEKRRERRGNGEGMERSQRKIEFVVHFLFREFWSQCRRRGFPMSEKAFHQFFNSKQSKFRLPSPTDDEFWVSLLKGFFSFIGTSDNSSDGEEEREEKGWRSENGTPIKKSPTHETFVKIGVLAELLLEKNMNCSIFSSLILRLLYLFGQLPIWSRFPSSHSNLRHLPLEINTKPSGHDSADRQKGHDHEKHMADTLFLLKSMSNQMEMIQRLLASLITHCKCDSETLFFLFSCSPEVLQQCCPSQICEISNCPLVSPFSSNPNALKGSELESHSECSRCLMIALSHVVSSLKTPS